MGRLNFDPLALHDNKMAAREGCRTGQQQDGCYFKPLLTEQSLYQRKYQFQCAGALE